MFSLKTILTTLIGTGVATSLVALPVRANENNLVNESGREELILSQNYGYGDRPTDTELDDSFKYIVGLTGLAIGTGVVGYHLTRAYKPSLVNSLPIVNNQNATLLDRVSPKLRRELLRLVHNKATASRLLSGTLTSHPGRNSNWLVISTYLHSKIKTLPL